jgi:hypothetical protein
MSKENWTVVGIVLLFLSGMFCGYEEGLKAGLDKYHEACYNVGGLVEGSDGSFVVCGKEATVCNERLDKWMKP